MCVVFVTLVLRFVCPLLYEERRSFGWADTSISNDIAAKRNDNDVNDVQLIVEFACTCVSCTRMLCVYVRISITVLA